jgi:hypothetical protein
MEYFSQGVYLVDLICLLIVLLVGIMLVEERPSVA